MFARNVIWNATLDKIKDGVIIVDASGKIEYLNNAATVLLEVPKDLCIGTFFPETVPNMDMIRCLSDHDFSRVQGKKITIKGHVLLIDCISLHEETFSGVAVILHDITVIRQIANDLGQTTERKVRLERFLDLLDEGIIITDAWGKITNVNRHLESYFSREKVNDCIGKKITDIFGEFFDFTDMPGENILAWKNSDTDKEEIICINSAIVNSGQTIGYVIKFRKDNNGLTNHFNHSYLSSGINTKKVATFTLNNIIGQSEAIIKLKKLARKISQTKSTILIQSESGTGKELFAHAIHNLSSRANSPFIKLNCASLPDSLLESEIFGYGEGAFTGARKGGYRGRFELASGGTLFLDEVGEMSLTMQVKFLRVLQEQEIQRLGDENVRKIDVRIICATNRELWPLVEQQKFREDLYYRLNIVNFLIPPLRDRREDIKPLIIYYIRKYSREFQKVVKGVSPEVYSAFLNYDWPGNVRELNNIIEYAFNIVDGEVIALEHLPSHFLNQKGQKNQTAKQLEVYLQECEKEALTTALKNSGGNKAEAANALGISRASLYRKLTLYS